MGPQTVEYRPREPYNRRSTRPGPAPLPAPGCAGTGPCYLSAAAITKNINRRHLPHICRAPHLPLHLPRHATRPSTHRPNPHSRRRRRLARACSYTLAHSHTRARALGRTRSGPHARTEAPSAHTRRHNSTPAHSIDATSSTCAQCVRARVREAAAAVAVVVTVAATSAVWRGDSGLVARPRLYYTCAHLD